MRRKQYFAAAMALGLMGSALAGTAAHADDVFNIDMTGYDDTPWTTIAMANDDTVLSGVCIREAESEESKALGYLYRGGAVNVLKKGAEWSEVESGGMIGYIRNEYLTFGTEAKGLAEYYGYYGVEANWNDVKVFAADNANAKIIGTADDGETFPIVNNNGHWLEIQTGADSTAYVSSEDVTMVMVVDTAVSLEDEKNGGTGASTGTVTPSVSQQMRLAGEETAAETSSEVSYEDNSSAQTYTEESYSGESYTEESYTEESYSEESYSEESYSEESYSEESYSEESYSEESYSEESYSESGSDETWTDDGSTTEETYSEETYSDDAGTDETYADETWEEDAEAEESYEAEDTGTYEGEDYIEDTTSDETYTDETYTDETYTDETYTDESYSEDSYSEESYDDTYSEESYTEESTSTASSSDTDLLAALIWCEAGNQPYEGMVAVGAVVMNRVASSSFPNTISEVIYQSGQFTPAYSGALSSALANGVPSDCYSAAGDALAGSDPTGGALYFNTSHGSGVLIGAHWFY